MSDKLDWEACAPQPPPADFSERLALLVDGASALSEGRSIDWEAYAGQAPPQGFAERLAEQLAAAPSPGADVGAAAAETTATPSQPKADEPEAVPPPKRRRSAEHGEPWTRRRPRLSARSLGGAVALGAAAAAALVLALQQPAEQDPVPPPTTLAAAAWHGTVQRISQAGSGPGLQLCRAEDCRTLSQGSAVPAGSRLRTDAGSRAHLTLNDGTELTLDRSTELSLVGTADRRARLERGAIVAELVRLDGAAAARIDLPSGFVEVLGTKLALSSDDNGAAVDVSRGSVRLYDGAGQSAIVHAGEEGRLIGGAAPLVAAAPDLAETLAWTESHEVDEVMAVRGLGQLRAQRPGSQEELQGAVRLASHKVKVRIAKNLARTEIDETFANDTDQVLEGIYRFPLPPDAQIERLALEVDGQLLEGAFVERDRAAKIWRGAIANATPQKKPEEEIIWVPGPWKDPALLEWQRGGRFELRIYPIPRQGSRRVVLAYTQVVRAQGGIRRYVYPLAFDPSGSSRVDSFGLDIQVKGHDPALGVTARGYELDRQHPREGTEQLTMSARDLVPQGDLVVEYALPDRDSEVTSFAYLDEKGGAPAPSAAAASPGAAPAYVEEGYVAIALRPKLPRRLEQIRRSYALCVDTSRSMFGERYRRATTLAVRLIRELDRQDRVTVFGCDTTCRRLDGGWHTPGKQTAQAAEQLLSGITPEGGSDLGVLAQSAAAAAAEPAAGGGALRVIYLGDGAPTVGLVRPALITSAVRRHLPKDASVTAVAIGADADGESLAALARGGGGVVLPYVPGQRTGEAALAVLGASYGTGLRDVRLELPEGLSAVAPTRLDTIPAGGEVLVTARLSQPQIDGSLVLRGKVGSEDFEQRYPIAIRAARGQGNAFVPRLYAAARIAELQQHPSAEARQEAVELSQRFNVASRYTSLLVLESQAMFKAFGLDNTRRAPEWTGEEQIEGTLTERGELDVAEADQAQVLANRAAAHIARGDYEAAKDLFQAEVPYLPYPGSAALALRKQNMSSLPPSCAPGDPLCGAALDGDGTGRPAAAEQRGRSRGSQPATDRPEEGEKRDAAKQVVVQKSKIVLRSEAEKLPVKPGKHSVGLSCSPSDLMCQMRRAEVDEKARRPAAVPPRGGTAGAKEKGATPPTPAEAPLPPPPQAQPPRGLSTGCACGRDDLMCQMRCGRRSLIPMRRIWAQQGSVHPAILVPARASADKIAAAEQALEQDQNRRQAVQDLYVLYALAGDIKGAGELADSWSSRDPLDPAALTARADLAARSGRREQAIRMLASVLDVRPADVPAHDRLARLQRWADRPAQACRHALAIAQLLSSDAQRLADAARCARSGGDSQLAADLLTTATAEVARQALQLLETEEPPAAGLRGELRLEASWEGGRHDLDLALIDPEGHRVSWLGAPTRGLISATDVLSHEREGLALGGGKAGDYVIEIVRAAGEGPVGGEVTVTAAGQRRVIPFQLTGERLTLGTIVLSWQAHLVPW